MSEFSDSYHLRECTLQDGAALLARAGLHGFLFEPENGWLAVLPQGKPFELNQALLSASAPFLGLHLFFAEDHGWGFEVFQNESVLWRFEVDWNAGLRYPHPCQLGALLALAPTRAHSELQALLAALSTSNLEQALGDANAEAFAEAVGITHYRWLSYYGAVDDYDDPANATEPLVRCEPQTPWDTAVPFMVNPHAPDTSE